MISNIVVRLAGGLGNQLFQFAATLAFARKHGISNSNIYIDTRFLKNYESKHEFEIGLVTDLFPGVRIAQTPHKLVSIASKIRLAHLLDQRIGRFEFINSIHHLTNIKFPSEIKYFLLDGYFQHPDALFSSTLRLDIAKKLLNTRRHLIRSINGGRHTIGVHIRRGDYVTSNSASRVFRTVPLDYYRAAINKLPRDHKILVFSDDSRLSASFAREVDGIDVRHLKISLQDEFCLLMSCDVQVIANSTFSWWAGYLGYKPSRHVIAPKNWYVNKSWNQSNQLLLPHFNLIDL